MRLGDRLALAAPLLSAAVPLVRVFTAALRHGHRVQRNGDTKGQPAERLAESTGRIYRDCKDGGVSLPPGKSNLESPRLERGQSLMLSLYGSGGGGQAFVP